MITNGGVFLVCFLFLFLFVCLFVFLTCDFEIGVLKGIPSKTNTHINSVKMVNLWDNLSLISM